MRNFALALTLRARAKVLREISPWISRVEGRPKMADAVVTDVIGALDCGVGDIYDGRLCSEVHPKVRGRGRATSGEECSNAMIINLLDM